MSDVFLLADIGGTNARLALCGSGPDTPLIATQIYQVRENPTLIGTLRHFVQHHGVGMKVVRAAIAVACPVIGDIVQLTNSDWICDKNAIIKLLGTPDVIVINDFEAVAYALNTLAPTDITVMQQGLKSSQHPMLVMGPGTGLGIAALIPYDGGFKSVPTEAGHTRYAPANTNESEMVKIVGRELLFVSSESLISGPGLTNIYRALCTMADQLDKIPTRIEPAEVVTRARAGDSLAKQTLQEFAAIFGSFASQMALSYNALGGVYLAGGVLQKIGQDFDDARFLNRFTTNPTMANLLSRIPVTRVNANIPAFNGLQWLLKQSAGH
ncbi:MAG: glucokinase [Alphaproteobacteria bacterium]